MILTKGLIIIVGLGLEYRKSFSDPYSDVNLLNLPLKTKKPYNALSVIFYRQNYGGTDKQNRPITVYSTSATSCLQWSSINGTWEEYLTLDVERGNHVSWTPDPNIGTYLMGGVTMNSGRNSVDRNTTTLIKPDGSQEPGFSLKYNTA